MVEQVEEIAQRGVVRPNSLIDQFAIRTGQHPQRAVQPEEVHPHHRWTFAAPLQRLDLAGGEPHRRIRRETHHFACRVVEPAHHVALRRHPRHQPDRLEELEQVRFSLEQVRDRPARYSSIFWPARGGHCRRTSFRCRVRTRSWLKLFIETYKPRKYSSTLANRYTPTPTNCSSSNSISTCVPRANTTPSSEITRAKCRRLSNPTRPSICFSE